ncbi:MAG TPA: D-alanyl-D-alanine carboxypeptidase family protein [Candidatus Binataceae bacterium]|nr:D-alanyl-D-alanine carboxypeptidase family protein [Candidatus Binataceae bacterium]
MEDRWGGWCKGISFLIALAALGNVQPAAARTQLHRRHHIAHHRRHYPSVPLYHAELLIDADGGNVLYAQNASIEWPPASMAKLMLMAVAEDEIQAGHFSYEDPVRISARAAATGGSRLGLREGQVYPLGELMKAALIRSANDAAVAVAEKIAGSVEACVQKMNQKARALRMDNTYYGTVEGLPPVPGHDVDHTTAIDLSILARDLVNNTHLLRWTSMETAPFDDGRVILRNTNHLVGHLDGCDGLKTGFTMRAGFNLTATAKRGDMRLISVVLGAPSNPERFIQSARLLNWGFDNFAKVHLLNRGQPLPVHVQVEAGPSIQPVAEEDLALVLPKAQLSSVKLEYSVPATVPGPLANGAALGQVIVLDGGGVVSRVEAVSPPSANPTMLVSDAAAAAKARSENGGGGSSESSPALTTQVVPGVAQENR